MLQAHVTSFTLSVLQMLLPSAGSELMCACPWSEPGVVFPGACCMLVWGRLHLLGKLCSLLLRGWRWHIHPTSSHLLFSGVAMSETRQVIQVPGAPPISIRFGARAVSSQRSMQVSCILSCPQVVCDCYAADMAVSKYT